MTSSPRRKPLLKEIAIIILYPIFFLLLSSFIKPLILNIAKSVMLQLTLNKNDVWKLEPQQSKKLGSREFCTLTKSVNIKVKSLKVVRDHYMITLDHSSIEGFSQVCNDLKKYDEPGYLYISSPIIIDDITRFNSFTWLNQCLRNNINLLINLLTILILFVLVFFTKGNDDNLSTTISNNDIDALSTLIENIKEQIFKAQLNASKSDKNAMFVQGAIKINLKATAIKGQDGKFELKPVTLNQNISNEKVQDITIELNPLKVFSDKSANMKVEFYNTNIGSINTHITIADLVSINDKNYLWYESSPKSDPSNKTQQWVDASNIKKITLSDIKKGFDKEEDQKKRRSRYILSRYS